MQACDAQVGKMFMYGSAQEIEDSLNSEDGEESE
jgi:hypothetical protein